MVGSEAPVCRALGLCAFYKRKKNRCNGKRGLEQVLCGFTLGKGAEDRGPRAKKHRNSRIFLKFIYVCEQEK
jgi:hypothetical protein